MKKRNRSPLALTEDETQFLRSDRCAPSVTAPTLAEFLLARIAEDEVVARTAIEEYPVERYALYDDPTGLDTYCDRDYLEAMVRISPARVLAECEAKRRIVEFCDALAVCTLHDAEREDDCGECVVAAGIGNYDTAILERLAAVYADHPDFREEWRA